MKCCSAQIQSCWEDPVATLEKIEPCIRQAASSDAALIAFPEQFATGWDPHSHHHIEDLSGPIVSGLVTYAAEYSISILGSFRQRHDLLPTNTCVIIREDGSIAGQYAKMHPFSFAGEDRWYAPGDGISVFRLEGVVLGIAICYDLRFPELFRIYADKGVHGVVVPSAWPESRIRQWELFIRARAVENQMYIIGVNTTGKNPVDAYNGDSMTAGPDGSIIARAGNHEALLFSDLDAETVEDVRRHFPVYQDKRSDLYLQLHR